ncbi:MAG TPA: TraR/DksA C4-type zinc finger protein [Anaeromyxobacteraceae bacterium]|nr:TraR/DksA C4-type zinc finger protein [Anaeromyxobacteraceae bacterium]
MSRIESEARSLLLNRREALRRATEMGGGYEPDEVHAETVVVDRVSRELAEVDAALGRIAAGNYGTCSACGGPLGLQRLRAIPEARFCLGCSGHRPDDD